MNNLITQAIMAKKDRNAILSHLKNLMMYIIKWYSQEDKRSNSWKTTIKNSRDEITEIQADKPSINDEFLKKTGTKLLIKQKRKRKQKWNKNQK